MSYILPMIAGIALLFVTAYDIYLTNFKIINFVCIIAVLFLMASTVYQNRNLRIKISQFFKTGISHLDWLHLTGFNFILTARNIQRHLLKQNLGFYTTDNFSQDNHDKLINTFVNHTLIRVMSVVQLSQDVVLVCYEFSNNQRTSAIYQNWYYTRNDKDCIKNQWLLNKVVVIVD